MTSEIEKLTAQKAAIVARMKRRSEADKTDRAELYRLEHQLERAAAKTLIGQTVVLNPNSGLRETELRKLRGMTATVESVGQKYSHIKFANGARWQVRFIDVVAAMPTTVNSTDGDMLDELTTMLNAALGT